mmetsp:Transcript_13884/g.43036  ORF Transcript_13884/g.43036 Transcript_13884/m.43036 type:complete len:286 (-) Transcript_13884:170-1027(-)
MISGYDFLGGLGGSGRLRRGGRLPRWVERRFGSRYRRGLLRGEIRGLFRGIFRGRRCGLFCGYVCGRLRGLLRGRRRRLGRRHRRGRRSGRRRGGARRVRRRVAGRRRRRSGRRRRAPVALGLEAVGLGQRGHNPGLGDLITGARIVIRIQILVIGREAADVVRRVDGRGGRRLVLRRRDRRRRRRRQLARAAVRRRDEARPVEELRLGLLGGLLRAPARVARVGLQEGRRHKHREERGGGELLGRDSRARRRRLAVRRRDVCGYSLIAARRRAFGGPVHRVLRT